MASWGISDPIGVYEGVSLLDYQNGNLHPIVRARGSCQCSKGNAHIPAGASMHFWANFAAPPGDVDKVGIHFRNAQPIYGVPLSNQ